MKLAKKRNEPWVQLRLHPDFEPLVEKYRKLLGIPSKGVPDSDWEYGSELVYGKHADKNWPVVSEFIKGANALYPLGDDFKQLLIFYLVFGEGKATDVVLNEVNLSGCSFEATPGGLIIRIGPHTPIDELKEFISITANKIKSAQENPFYKMLHPRKYQRLRFRKNPERDYLVIKLSRIPRAQLEKKYGTYGINYKSKEAYIAKIMISEYPSLSKSITQSKDGTALIKTIIHRSRQR
ncbi:MAG: hypothetical protein Q8P77_01055 [Candidatus Veblenbacteria bacterium]|nr:hypothetical protein [Candidatus Veblenbacteria bacterium]